LIRDGRSHATACLRRHTAAARLLRALLRSIAPALLPSFAPRSLAGSLVLVCAGSAFPLYLLPCLVGSSSFLRCRLDVSLFGLSVRFSHATHTTHRRFLAALAYMLRRRRMDALPLYLTVCSPGALSLPAHLPARFSASRVMFASRLSRFCGLAVLSSYVSS